MESNRPDKVMAFDSLFTTNHIQMLKILLAFLPSVLQRHLAIYIKMLELQYTLSFFQEHPFAELPFCVKKDNITGVFDDLFPFCTKNEREKLQDFKNIYQNIQNMQEIMQFMELMREISPELFASDRRAENPGSPADVSGTAPDIGNLLQLFSGFGGMDLSQMTELLYGMFPPDPGSAFPETQNPGTNLS